MRAKVFLGVAAILALTVTTASADWFDNFDSYALGQLTPQSTWVNWGGPDDPAVVSDAQALSSPQSVAVSGGSDLVHTYSGYTSGQWSFTASQYIPDTSAGTQYFILLNTFPTSVNAHWSVQLPFDMDANLLDGSIPIVENQWAEIRVEIDLDANTFDCYYNETPVTSGQWADLGNGGQLAIQALDLYPDGGTVGVVYYDDISLVPEPGTLVLLLCGALAITLGWWRRRRAE